MAHGRVRVKRKSTRYWEYILQFREAVLVRIENVYACECRKGIESWGIATGISVIESTK